MATSVASTGGEAAADPLPAGDRIAEGGRRRHECRGAAKEGLNEAPAREGHGREPPGRVDAAELEEGGRDLTWTAKERRLALAEPKVALRGLALRRPTPRVAWLCRARVEEAEAGGGMRRLLAKSR